jgi:xanthine dehydrogenase molybdopterin binding subunit/xanthine dehydrogenase small subunit
MVDHFGSQCGYCTPGFTVSLFEAYYRKSCTEPWQISDQLCGNLCRCTGYRPIRDAAMAALAERKNTPVDDIFAAKLKQPAAALTDLDHTGSGERFVRPLSLPALFAALKADPAARLVAGATEIGVDINKKARPFPFLVSTEGVPELTQITATPEAWLIGAAAVMTAVEEALGDEYPSLQKMLRVFAARQIRNRATFGGNLATASPIGDGPPILLALDASVVLASETGERTMALTDFFLGYRKTALAAGEIIKTVVIPRTPGKRILADSFKVSKRRELDISIVAAAYSLELGEGDRIVQARLAYGGVAATPVRAKKAEAALIGRTLAEAGEDVAQILATEFQPIADVRSGADFRKGLIVSLWKKFVSGDRSIAQDEALNFTTDAPWPVEDASKSLRHESAVGHVTGRALYVDDVAQRRPMLDVWPVCSPHARARILKRDISAALAAPGVVTVLVGEDVPGHNDVGVHHDEPLFAMDEIRYHSQVVAVVVGHSLRECRAAAALVKVEYEVLTPVLGIQEAIAQGLYHSPAHALKRGDCEAALAAAPRTLEGEFSFGGQEHFYLESHACWAEAGEEGSVVLSSSTQHPSEIQTIVSEVLGQPRSKIVVQAPRMGGGFGGKETQGNAFAAIVALASVKTGQPVRIQLDRDLDMMLTGKRHPFYSKFKVGFDDEGMLLASQVHLVSDGGWSMDLSQPILDRALFHLDNGYYIPAVHFSGLIANTNVTSHTAFRGFGGPQGMLVVEEIIDRVARQVGLPAELVREKNLYRGTGETNTTHYNEEIGDNRLQTIWHAAKSKAAFEQRRQSVAAWNATHAVIKKGLAITPVKFGISFTLSHYNQAGALVHIYQDGTVQVNHGGTEMGQGLYTKILGVAMRELGLPRESIRMMATSTDKVPNTSATAASSGADLNGAAVQNACEILRHRLVPVAAKLLGEIARRDFPEDAIRFADGHAFVMSEPGLKVPFVNVVLAAYQARVSLSTTGFYQTPGVKWNWATTTGRPFHYFACGAAVAEVEVDGYSGMHRILRVDIVHDVGDSLNPGVDRGQIEGAFVQGVGWLTREELLWDKKGKLLTHSASTYQIPAISDAPLEMNVTLLPHASTGDKTVHGSKAVGEPPFMLAFAAREAIRDAIAQFGEPGGEIPLASPATHEAIFKSIQARLAARPPAPDRVLSGAAPRY